VLDILPDIEDSVPADIAGLLSWLDKRGFTIHEQNFSREHFGNCVLVLAAWPIAFRIVRDRGRWSINVAGHWDGSPPPSSAESAWFWERLWVTFLDGRQAPTDRPVNASLDGQISFFQDRLADIDAALRKKDQINQNLSEIRRRNFEMTFLSNE
jgi:hypothetical protein